MLSTAQFGSSLICVAPLKLPAMCGAPVALVFGAPSHGSDGTLSGKGLYTGRDSGAGFKNRTRRPLQQGGRGHTTTPRNIWCKGETFNELEKVGTGLWTR